MGQFSDDLGPLHSPGVIAGLYQAFAAIIRLLHAHGETSEDVLRAVHDVMVLPSPDWEILERELRKQGFD